MQYTLSLKEKTYLENNPRIDEFIGTMNSDATKRSYAAKLQNTGIEDSFLKMPKEQQEETLRKFIFANKGKVTPVHIQTCVGITKSLCDYYEINSINWKKIKKFYGKVNHIGNDRAPTVEEIRQLLSICDFRGKALVLTLSSSGMRVGGIAGLTVGDYNKIKSKTAQKSLVSSCTRAVLSSILLSVQAKPSKQ